MRERERALERLRYRESELEEERERERRERERERERESLIKKQYLKLFVVKPPVLSVLEEVRETVAVL